MSTSDERLQSVEESIDDAKKAAEDVAERGAINPDPGADVGLSGGEEPPEDPQPPADEPD